MSWSVIVARTRMWRTMVAIMRGGNLGGAAWQRPQLERKRFSPSTCIFSFCALCSAETVGAGESFAVSLPPLPALAIVPNDRALAARNAAKRNLIFIARLLAAASA